MAPINPYERTRAIRVYVNDQEHHQIEQQSVALNLSASTYLRQLGLNCKPKPMTDLEAMRKLAHLHGDLGRLGGLLKLTIVEFRNQKISPNEARTLLHKIEATRQDLAFTMRRLIRER
jgi:hypothetical protein